MEKSWEGLEDGGRKGKGGEKRKKKEGAVLWRGDVG